MHASVMNGYYIFAVRFNVNVKAVFSTNGISNLVNEGKHVFSSTWESYFYLTCNGNLNSNFFLTFSCNLFLTLPYSISCFSGYFGPFCLIMSKFNLILKVPFLSVLSFINIITNLAENIVKVKANKGENSEKRNLSVRSDPVYSCAIYINNLGDHSPQHCPEIKSKIKWSLQSCLICHKSVFIR